MNTRYVERADVLQFENNEAIHEPTEINHLEYLFVEDDRRGVAEMQSLHFGVAEPENPKGVLIVPVSWSDFSKKPFQELRLGAMARFSGLRVIGVDFPQMGNIDESPELGNKLTKLQKQEARTGRLTNLTEKYWTALDELGLLTSDADEQELLPVSLWGNSLSTLTVTEMAANAPEGVSIIDLYLSEIMALQKIPFPIIMGRMGIMGGKDLESVYLAGNTSLPEYESSGLKGLANQIRQQKMGHLFYPVVALSKGKQQRATEDAIDRETISFDVEHGTTVHVVNAEKGLSPKRRLLEYSDFLFGSMGHSRKNLNRVVLPGEYHGYQDNLPAVLHQVSGLSIVNACK